jgi:predicted regulator of Ras-like GTPase activity (Roadblock/LC7/MglB family)
MSDYDQASIRLLQAELEGFQARMTDICGIAVVDDDHMVLATTIAGHDAVQVIAETPSLVEIARRLFAVYDKGESGQIVLAGALDDDTRYIIFQPIIPTLSMIIFTMPGTKIGLMRLDVHYIAQQIARWWPSQRLDKS